MIHGEIKTLNSITTSFLLGGFPLGKDDRNLLRFHSFLGLYCLFVGSFPKEVAEGSKLLIGVYPKLINSEPSQKHDFHTALQTQRNSNSKFLNSSTTDIWDQIILHGGGCPVHHRVFTSTPGLCPTGCQ